MFASKFLQLAASTSKLTSIFFFFWPIRPRPANQLVLVHSDASGSICQLSPRRTSFARGRGCQIALGVGGCGLRLEITSHVISRFAFLLQRLNNAGEDRPGTVPFLFSHRTRSSGARVEESRGSGLELVTRGQHWTINGVFLAATSEN